MRYLIDFHVHIYDQYNLDQYFNIAWKNFSDHQQSNEQCHRILMLTETRHDNYFSYLSQHKKAGDWVVENTSNCRVLKLVYKQQLSKTIYLVAGQQVISNENIELSIFCDESKDLERAPIKEIIDAKIDDENVFAALPWGVGKWLGARGESVSNLINQYQDALFLSDNSGRPIFWRKPKHFSDAESQRVQVLSGSDPLPIRGGEKKVASYISVVDDDKDFTEDVDIPGILRNLKKMTVRHSGKRAGLISFFYDQVSMQIRKHIN